MDSSRRERHMQSKLYYTRLNALARRNLRAHIWQQVAVGVVIAALTLLAEWGVSGSFDRDSALAVVIALAIYGLFAALWYWRRAPVEMDKEQQTAIARLNNHVKELAAVSPFTVDFHDPWSEPHSTKDGVWVIRSEVSVVGAKGECGVDLVDIRATRKTGGGYLPIAWTDSPDKWQNLPVGLPQQTTIGETSPLRGSEIRWFTVRAPGPTPSQGTDRMTAVSEDDPFIYFRLRITDKSSDDGVSRESDPFRLGVKDGEPFCETAQEAINS